MWFMKPGAVAIEGRRDECDIRGCTIIFNVNEELAEGGAIVHHSSLDDAGELGNALFDVAVLIKTYNLKS